MNSFKEKYLSTDISNFRRKTQLSSLYLMCLIILIVIFGLGGALYLKGASTLIQFGLFGLVWCALQLIVGHYFYNASNITFLVRLAFFLFAFGANAWFIYGVLQISFQST